MLTAAQLQTLNAWIIANVPNATEHTAQAALNAVASPDYWTWKTQITRAELYFATSPTGSTFNFATYKSQQVPEQNTWVQLFMGDETNMALLNVRAAIKAVFSGSAAQNTQRDHCFAVGRRKATQAEKVLAVAVVAPPVDTGNDTGQARGSAANPDVMTFEGQLTIDEVIAAMNS